MKTHPETRQSRIVEVLRIESSKILLGPADASTVPFLDADRRRGIPTLSPSVPRYRLRILRFDVELDLITNDVNHARADELGRVEPGV
jgi:hypothetical protein